VRLSIVVFHPLPETRVANTVPGLLLVALCVNVLLEGNDVPGPIVLAGLVIGLVVAVRGFRTGVVVTDGRVTVRGFWRSRSVPASDVVAVTRGTLPLLLWRDSSARDRRSPILAFMDAYNGMARYSSHNREALRLVRLEIARERGR
jgi:hypothetical protein